MAFAAREGRRIEHFASEAHHEQNRFADLGITVNLLDVVQVLKHFEHLRHTALKVRQLNKMSMQQQGALKTIQTTNQSRRQTAPTQLVEMKGTSPFVEIKQTTIRKRKSIIDRG